MDGIAVEGRKEEEGEKWPIFRGGVTGGVTKWGYIFQKVGLHIWGFAYIDREGEKYHFEGVERGKHTILDIGFS